MKKPVNIFPWQESNWKAISELIVASKVPQAFLLYGIPGLGKHQFADYLAKTLLCSARKTVPCEDCRSCHLFRAGTHPDLYKLIHLEKSQQIKIQQVRDVNSRVCQKSQLDNAQVIIIEHADSLTHGAANSLLKILEEPPGDVIFILVTNHFHRLLPTVRSRCRLFSFQSVGSQRTSQWLKDAGHDIDNLPESCLGGPLQLKTLIEDDYLTRQKKWIDDLCALSLDKCKAIAIASTWQGEGESLFFLLDTLYSWILDVVKLTLIGDVVRLQNEAMRETLKDWSKNCQTMDLQNYLAKIVNLRALTNEKANINLQLSLEALLLEWPVNSQNSGVNPHV